MKTSPHPGVNPESRTVLNPLVCTPTYDHSPGCGKPREDLEDEVLRRRIAELREQHGIGPCDGFLRATIEEPRKEELLPAANQPTIEDEVLRQRIAELREQHGIGPDGRRLLEPVRFKKCDDGFLRSTVEEPRKEELLPAANQPTIEGDVGVDLLWKAWSLGIAKFLEWAGVWKAHRTYVLRTMGKRKPYLFGVFLRVLDQVKKGRKIVRLGAYFLQSIFDRSRNPIPHPKCALPGIRKLGDVLQVLVGRVIYDLGEPRPSFPGGPIRLFAPSVRRRAGELPFARPG